MYVPCVYTAVRVHVCEHVVVFGSVCVTMSVYVLRDVLCQFICCNRRMSVSMSVFWCVYEFQFMYVCSCRTVYTHTSVLACARNLLSVC